MKNGRRSNRINFVYLSDGYTAAELNLFTNHVNNINNALFNTIPFLQYKSYFNSFTVKVPSNASGAKHPANASDEAYSGSNPVQPVANPDNYFQSTFDYGSVHRLLVPLNNTAIYSILASNLPDYDQPFVIVNSPYYGGSGGTYSTSSIHTSAPEIAIHEIGHSFAGLADEYWISLSRAAEKPNMTADNNTSTVKWKSWLGINNTGLYQHGASGDAANWFKPSFSCKMQALGNPFCSVCSQRFIDNIHQLVNMIDNYTPSSTSFALTTTDSVSLSVDIIPTQPNNIIINWYLNNTLFTTGTSSLKIAFSTLQTGANLVKAEAIDPTPLSKSYLPGSGYVNAITWTITKPSTLPAILKSFTGQVQAHNGFLRWQIAPGITPHHFELLKSRDGNNFFHLTTLACKQNETNYSYTDEKLQLPYSYYKLKIVENDGSYINTNVIKLQYAADNYSYKIYQDAVQHKYMLTAKVENIEPVSFSITDASGRNILKKNFGKVNEQLMYNFDLTKFPVGIYFLKLNINHSLYTSQIVAK